MARTLVFIPAWNEEASLAAVLAEARHDLPDVDLLVVDDGSTDTTAEVAREGGALVVSFPENRGLRHGIAEGYRRAADGGYDYCGHLVATLLTQIEDALGLTRRIGISALIETAKGMLNVEEIASACPERMEALIFGVADYAASIQSHTASIGGSDRQYAVMTDPGEDGLRELHWGDQ